LTIEYLFYMTDLLMKRFRVPVDRFLIRMRKHYVFIKLLALYLETDF